jgi:hypothetical protein
MADGGISKRLLRFPAEQGWVSIDISITHPVLRFVFLILNSEKFPLPLGVRASYEE